MTDTRNDPAAAFAELNRMLLGDAAGKLGTGALPDFAEMMKQLSAGFAADGGHWLELNNRYYREHLELWHSCMNPQDGQPPPPPPADRRFRAPEWQEPYYSYLAHSYLLSARWLEEMAAAARSKLDEHPGRKLDFYTRQMIDSMSPANFPWTNPEAIKLAAATEGESISRGLKNLAADIDRGLVSMTDETAFEVGRNLAITPGAVVFENDFMQLLQYAPLTAEVHARPLVMIPPCINKYYILDLQPDNSFVRHAITAGHTVFMVSWRNMPAEMGHATWDDYLEQGVMRALAVAQEITGAEQVNALGFCVGGTLLASALAVLRARGENPVASLTLLTTMLDFSDTGELSVFIDETYVATRETEFAQGGVLRGRELALTFASLRANDLIWPYVVNNYLKGRTPEAFDLLYWNSDSTNLPGVMYRYYLRNTYLENKLRIPGKLTMCGMPVDLGRVDMPAYLLAAREDHIVPWRTAYASTGLLGGQLQFVLAASGHIAGVINPAARNKRNFWTRDTLDPQADAWLEGATSVPGSWWTHWINWLENHGGGQTTAPAAAGSAAHPPLEPAPGRYVKDKKA
ncbi:MAG: class I poly(R)-hydroxyalkanoic acid synthase [Burkholderiales bacterium]|nr:class I poly(R)-hydroxyalkanoic acid synthase [Burkholderiales bacterium]